jgi:hypothetical protein
VNERRRTPIELLPDKKTTEPNGPFTATFLAWFATANLDDILLSEPRADSDAVGLHFLVGDGVLAGWAYPHDLSVGAILNGVNAVTSSTRMSLRPSSPTKVGGVLSASTIRRDIICRSNSFGSRTCLILSAHGATRRCGSLGALATTVKASLGPSSRSRKTKQCISKPSIGRAVQHKYVTMTNEPDALELWATNHRNCLEPIIRERFRARGQADDEASEYIAGCCWQHPAVALRRFWS